MSKENLMPPLDVEPEDQARSKQELEEATEKALEAAKAVRDGFVKESKQCRVDLDAVLQKLKGPTRASRERNLAITKIQEAIMWLGMDLKALHEVNPYPNSYKPENAIVEPTADNLKL